MRTLRLSLVGPTILFLLGGLLGAVVAQDDEGVTTETLFEVTIPADALPEALEKVNIETLTVDAGVDVSIGIENEALRGKALYLDSGELVLEPMVDALLWPQGAAPGSAPVIAPAAEELRLLPGDLVFLPAIPYDELREDAAIRIANPGSEPARMLGFHTHERGGSFPGFPAGIGFTYHSASSPEVLELVSSGEAVFRLSRVVVEPGASVPLPAEALLTFYRIEAGEVERVMRGQGGEMSTVLIEGTAGYAEANPDLEYELTVVGQSPARVLELAVLPPTATGEVPVVTQDETEPVGGNAWYVGAATCPEVVSPGTVTIENGVEQVRDAVYDCMSTTDAPRLNGPYTLHHNYDCYLLSTPTPGYSGCVMWGTSVSPEPNGWTATYTGVEDASGQQTVQVVGIGFGANAGWVFYEVDTLSAASGTSDVEGLLYQGAPPPAVPLPSPAGE